jgi:sugar lactone lactonase YvrE
MKKTFLLSLLLPIVAFFPLTVNGAAGYLYEPDISTGSIFQFTTTESGTVLKTTFATGLTGLRGIAFDHAGNLFAAQEERIIKISPTGAKSVFASDLHGPNFLAVDRANNLYASDRDGQVLRITPQGTKSVYVSGLDKPTGVALDVAGNLFVADFATNRIYKVTPSGTKTTFAFGLNGPQGLTFDRFGNLWLANSGAGTVEAFTPVGSRFTTIFNLTSPISLAFDERQRTTADVNARDDLYVAENCNGGPASIQKFTSESETGEEFTTDVGCPMQLAFEPPRDPLLNISTRARTGADLNHELIGGFIITGTNAKTVLIRALGPSLAKSGVKFLLQDPTLELKRPDGTATSNDNWVDSPQRNEIEATGLAPTDVRESALFVSLEPGAYTAIVRGKAPFEDGIGLVEVYDLDLAADSTLANISTRAFVHVGESVMIGGFVVNGGNGAGKVLIRALGPSLRQFGVHDAMDDPTLSLFNAEGTELLSNDDWADTQATEISGTGIAPPHGLESAIITTLPTGSYTAILEGYQGDNGVALIEVYNVR